MGVLILVDPRVRRARSRSTIGSKAGAQDSYDVIILDDDPGEANGSFPEARRYFCPVFRPAPQRRERLFDVLGRVQTHAVVDDGNRSGLLLQEIRLAYSGARLHHGVEGFHDRLRLVRGDGKLALTGLDGKLGQAFRCRRRRRRPPMHRAP